MKNVERVRQEVVSHTARFLEHLRVRWSMYFGDDPELLTRIDRPNHADLTVLITNTLMRELGDNRPGAKEPRYDRTRRLVSQTGKADRGHHGKGLRGERAALTKAERRKLAAGETA